VFAIVGHVGSGAGWVTARLAEQLAASYEPKKIKVSDLIADAAGVPKSGPSLQRTRNLQGIGDQLRAKFGANMVAGTAIRHIAAIRNSRGLSDRSVAFIIDSLKHQEEVEALRNVYGSSFYLLSVVCNEETRLRRLRKKHKEDLDNNEFRKLMKRDEGDSIAHGQHVRKTLELGDLFIVNEDESDTFLNKELDRFVAAITGSRIIRPSIEERGMHAAWSASLRSACMSRQVGACLLSQDGEVIASGTNDPPAYLGGVYHDGSEPDHRCFQWYPGEDRAFCRNDREKASIYASVFEELSRDKLLSADADPERIRRAISRTRVRDLIEFSRAVHAEMDAILALARSSGRSTLGATLYCTTYPCHSCARHIVAAGIVEVVYIEPYTKSMAIELHGDSIAETSVPGRSATRLPLIGTSIPGPTVTPSQGRVIFRLFSGIAPRRYPFLFESLGDLKDKDGKLAARKEQHVDPVYTKSFLGLEESIAQIVAQQLKEFQA